MLVIYADCNAPKFTQNGTGEMRGERKSSRYDRLAIEVPLIVVFQEVERRHVTANYQKFETHFIRSGYATLSGSMHLHQRKWMGHGVLE